MLDGDPEQPRAKGTTMKENSNTQAGTYNFLEGLSNLLSPFHSIATLSSMEKGKLTSSSTSILYPPVIFPDPQHSMGNVLSLSTVEELTNEELAYLRQPMSSLQAEKKPINHTQIPWTRRRMMNAFSHWMTTEFLDSWWHSVMSSLYKNNH
jgi:hypothetical protein